LRVFALRSRDAACFRGALVFFAEPFRAGAAARFAAFATGRLFFVAGRRLSAARLSVLGAGAVRGLAALATVRTFACALVEAVTFSAVFAGAVFVVFRTSFAGGGAVLWVTTAGDGLAEAAFVLPFGRPPFRAN
jgi:hypothetical protein